MTAPITHLTQAQSLTADGIVELFEITLLGAPTLTKVFFKDGATATWQANTYQSMACKLSGVKRSASEEKTRPTLVVMNPVGVFNSFAFNGYFEGSTLIHSRVLQPDLVANANIADVRYWRVSRVFGMMSNQSVSFELRAFADGPAFMIPARQYLPDSGFPFVTL